MPDEQHPRTANELRTVCEGWPQAVDPDAPQDAPPLTPEAVSVIARQLQRQQQ